MEMALGELGHDIGKISKENLFRMVKDFDLDILQSMLEPLF